MSWLDLPFCAPLQSVLFSSAGPPLPRLLRSRDLWQGLALFGWRGWERWTLSCLQSNRKRILNDVLAMMRCPWSNFVPAILDCPHACIRWRVAEMCIGLFDTTGPCRSHSRQIRSEGSRESSAGDCFAQASSTRRRSANPRPYRWSLVCKSGMLFEDR